MNIVNLGTSKRNMKAGRPGPPSAATRSVRLLFLVATSTALRATQAFSLHASVPYDRKCWANTATRVVFPVRRRSTLSMSYDGDDTPSDVGDATSVIPVAGDNPELRETMKREIMTIAATSNRGQVATQEEKDVVMDLVYQLEARNPNPDATNVNAVGGVWELVYSDTQPFRSSPFFMAIGELLGDEKERAEMLFALHRACTSNGEIGRIKQIISEAALVSEIDLKVGVVPGIPVALKGTVVTRAKLTPVSNDSFNVAVEGTKVVNNNILSFLDGAVELPLERIYNSLRGDVPEVKLSTYYLDENMRISRTPDDHIFIYVRATIP